MFSVSEIYALPLCRNFSDFNRIFLKTGTGKRAGEFGLTDPGTSGR
jgi:hypothetical protein